MGSPLTSSGITCGIRTGILAVPEKEAHGFLNTEKAPNALGGREKAEAMTSERAGRLWGLPPCSSLGIEDPRTAVIPIRARSGSSLRRAGHPSVTTSPYESAGLLT
jgi:hypothetical protein